MKEVIDVLDNYLKDNDTVIIGVSTGADSMCLLSIVENLNKNINIICAHINHNVRKESKDEYLFLEDYCQKHHVTFEGYTINEKIDSNFEEKARKIRYRFYEKLMKKYHAKYIMTAHHGDDEIETILMRLTRGSNLSGYIGIKLVEGHYFRPLLYASKEDIINYINENKIKYYEDKTNYEDDYTRNRFRHNILPFLKKENSTVHTKFLKFSNDLLAYDEFLKKYIKDNKLIINNKSFVSKLLKEDILVQKKVIELMIKNIQKDDLLEVSDQNMQDIIKFIHTKKSNGYIMLANNYKLIKEYDEIRIVKDHTLEKINIVFHECFENDKWRIKVVEENNDKSNYVFRINSKDIKLPLIIRTRQEKDAMEVKNLGTKKIKDIFINEKVTIDKRDTWPLLVDSSNNILWIPGLKKSKFDKEKNEKYDIILLCERKD